MEYKFLLIEDNVIDQLVTSQLLKRDLETAEISIVNNGREGIEWLYENKIGFDTLLIILLDIRMPEMDGFEFLSEYEKLPEQYKKKTQIFMLSSTLDPEDIQRAKNNNYVQKLLEKPLAVKELKKMILPEN